MSSEVAPPAWTALQGQYLAFIYAYATIHGVAPAEHELQRFFGVTPPSVHRMVMELERKGWIAKQPGVARSIDLRVAPETLPLLRRP